MILYNCINWLDNYTQYCFVITVLYYCISSVKIKSTHCPLKRTFKKLYVKNKNKIKCNLVFHALKILTEVVMINV